MVQSCDCSCTLNNTTTVFDLIKILSFSFANRNENIFMFCSSTSHFDGFSFRLCFSLLFALSARVSNKLFMEFWIHQTITKIFIYFFLFFFIISCIFCIVVDICAFRTFTNYNLLVSKMCQWFYQRKWWKGISFRLNNIWMLIMDYGCRRWKSIRICFESFSENNDNDRHQSIINSKLSVSMNYN